MNRIKLVMLATALAVTTSGAQAQMPGSSQPAVTPGDLAPQPSGGAFTMGFSFTAATGTFLNGLGAYDFNGDGFAVPMSVGLWDNAGTLLVQASVTSSDPLLNSFRYAPVTSYALQAGTTYVVGAFRYAGAGETYATGFGTGTTAPGITTLQARYSDSGSFAFPNQAVNTNGYFGANALVGDQVIVGGGGGVPEPATWAMMLIGFGGLGYAMRRRSTRTRFRAA